MKKKRKILILGCFIVFLFIGGKIMLTSLLNNVNQILVTNPDLSDRLDGIYIGEYSITPVQVKVKVSVENHKLTNIEILKHNNGLGGKAEKIIDTIIKKQSLEIDTVSGATVSSECILKAIENALQNKNE